MRICSGFYRWSQHYGWHLLTERIDEVVAGVAACGLTLILRAFSIRWREKGTGRAAGKLLWIGMGCSWRGLTFMRCCMIQASMRKRSIQSLQERG